MPFFPSAVRLCSRVFYPISLYCFWINFCAATGGEAAEPAAGFGKASGSLCLPEQIRDAPAVPQPSTSHSRAAEGGQSAQRSGGFPGLSRYQQPQAGLNPPSCVTLAAPGGRVRHSETGDGMWNGLLEHIKAIKSWWVGATMQPSANY